MKQFNKKVKVINTEGLSEETISMIEPIMVYTNNHKENETMFVQLNNTKGQIIKIFPERILII